MKHRSSFETDLDHLAIEAVNEARLRMIDAINLIDATPGYGHGYALTHPALVAAFMQTSALIYHAERLAGVAETIARAIHDVSVDANG
jgi:hypothetical protein